MHQLVLLCREESSRTRVIFADIVSLSLLHVLLLTLSTEGSGSNERRRSPSESPNRLIAALELAVSFFIKLLAASLQRFGRIAWLIVLRKLVLDVIDKKSLRALSSCRCIPTWKCTFARAQSADTITFASLYPVKCVPCSLCITQSVKMLSLPFFSVIE